MPDNIHDHGDRAMDDRLRRAGEAWRVGAAGSQAPPSVDVVDRIDAAVPVHWSRVLLVGSAAAVAAALIVGGGIALHDISGDPSAGRGGAIAGTVWRLVGYGGQPRDASSSATLYLGHNGRLVADDTCEVVGARADMGANRLDVTDVDVRYRGCADSVGETTFARGLDVLSGRPSFSVDGDGLTIGDGSEAMHFASVPDAVPPTLDVPTFLGTTWQLVTTSDSQGTARATRGEQLRVTDGRMRADTGCGPITADVTVSGDRVHETRLLKNKAECPNPPGTARVMKAVLQNGGAITQRVSGDVLTVSRPAAGTLTYRWVPQRRQATDPSELVGRRWQLRSSPGGVPATATLQISTDGIVIADDGCQAFHGSADITRGTVTIAGTPSAARRTCPDYGPATTVDSYLRGTVLWSVVDGSLTINPGGAQADALVYRLAPQDDPTAAGIAKLVGREWTATSLRRGPDGPDVRIHPPIGVQFSPTSFRLTAGCGPPGGTLHVSATRITFTTPAGPHGCPSLPVGSQDPVAARLLTGSVSWSVRADRLVLSRDGLRVTFKGR